MRAWCSLERFARARERENFFASQRSPDLYNGTTSLHDEDVALSQRTSERAMIKVGRSKARIEALISRGFELGAAEIALFGAPRCRAAGAAPRIEDVIRGPVSLCAYIYVYPRARGFIYI